MTSHHSDTTGHEAWEICLNQLDTLPSSGYWCVACGFSLNVFLQGNQWWRHEMSAVFSVWNPSLSSMLESKRRTANNTKSWHHLKSKFSSFWLSQYISCSPEWYFVPREPLAVNSLFMRQISAKICCCEAFSSRMWPTPPLNPQATLKAIYDNQEITGIPRPFVQDCSFSTPSEQSLIGWGGEKEALPESRPWPLRSPQPELLD